MRGLHAKMGGNTSVFGNIKAISEKYPEIFRGGWRAPRRHCAKRLAHKSAHCAAFSAIAHRFGARPDFDCAEGSNRGSNRLAVMRLGPFEGGAEGQRKPVKTVA